MDREKPARQGSAQLADHKKKMKRINLEEWLLEGDRMVLTGPSFHRARNVLRVREGDWLAATDGRGTEYTLSIMKVGSGRIEAGVVKTSRGLGESPLKITLAQALPKGARMDLVVQKATELGVDRIVPLEAARSVSRPGVDRSGQKVARWEKIAAESVAQCGRTRSPIISRPVSLEVFLQEASSPVRILLSAHRGATPFSKLEAEKPARVEVIAGPEGGFESGEVEACRKAGFVPVSLGPRVLRTETAGLVALSLIQHRWGDLG